MKFQIVCDSAADLPHGYAEKRDITVVPFYISLDGKNYLREGLDITTDELYKSMVSDDDCYPKTSMPSIQDYIDSFMPSVRQNIPVLCICLTQKFSGSYQAAVNARAAVLEDHPGAEIQVLDSQLVTSLEGLFVSEACRLRDMDMDIDRAVSLLKPIRETGRIFITTKDLKYL